MLRAGECRAALAPVLDVSWLRTGLADAPPVAAQRGGPSAMGVLRSETMSRGTLVVPADRARDVLFEARAPEHLVNGVSIGA